MTLARQVDFLAAGVRDSSNRALSGGKVFFYEPGSTTNLKDIWEDAEKAIVHVNPVTLNNIGAATVFAQGEYDIRIVDKNDVPFRDYFSFEYEPKALPVEQVELPWIDASEFGSGDDSDAIIQAISSAGGQDATVCLPPGQWLIDSNVIVPDNIMLKPTFGSYLDIQAGITFDSSVGRYEDVPYNWIQGAGTFVENPNHEVKLVISDDPANEGDVLLGNAAYVDNSEKSLTVQNEDATGTTSLELREDINSPAPFSISRNNSAAVPANEVTIKNDASINFDINGNSPISINETSIDIQDTLRIENTDPSGTTNLEMREDILSPAPFVMKRNNSTATNPNTVDVINDADININIGGNPTLDIKPTGIDVTGDGYISNQLGINKTPPTEALDVDGNLRGTGNLILGAAGDIKSTIVGSNGRAAFGDNADQLNDQRFHLKYTSVGQTDIMRVSTIEDSQSIVMDHLQTGPDSRSNKIVSRFNDSNEIPDDFVTLKFETKTKTAGAVEGRTTISLGDTTSDKSYVLEPETLQLPDNTGIIYRNDNQVDNTKAIKKIVFPIGNWNMLANDEWDVEIPTAFSFAANRTLTIQGIIYNDSGSNAYQLPHPEGLFGEDAQVWIYREFTPGSTTPLVLRTKIGGFFQSANFSSAVTNRGYITVEYF